MGLLATKKDDSELAEALHLEAVLVLDRLPEVRTHLRLFLASGCAARVGFQAQTGLIVWNVSVMACLMHSTCGD